MIARPLRYLSVAAVLAALALPVAAQDTRALAEQYVQMPGVQKMLDDMLAPEALIAQLSASLPPGSVLTDDQKTRIGAVMSESMGAMRPQMEAAMIDASASTFTAPEITALIAFYQSPEGASVMAKMQPMMVQVMGKIGPEMATVQQTMIPKVMAIMQEPQ